ncbi:hypothetical protein A4V12_10120 [Streptomyces noursei]|nr:hypothetical protein A4V12_10120 [Streptomyces noursei]
MPGRGVGGAVGAGGSAVETAAWPVGGRFGVGAGSYAARRVLRSASSAMAATDRLRLAASISSLGGEPFAAPRCWPRHWAAARR